jgi:NNP family nitrate/nitrite transporter-like MFS transporter
MFTPKIVGTANALTAGWGNMGGGATHFVMIAVTTSLHETAMPYVPQFEAWRWAFFVPGGIYLLFGVGVLLCAQDLPDGAPLG